MRTQSVIDVLRAQPEAIRKAVTDGIPMMNVSRIATHEWPHLDEIVALTLIIMYGEKAFPGIGKGVELVSISGMETEQNYGKDAWYKMLSEGILSIGTGGGPLDDHYDNDGNAKKQGSATGRVAYFLGIEERPEIQHLIRYVDHEDNNGDNSNLTGSSGETARSAQHFMLATTIKSTWRMMRQEGKEGEFTKKMKEFMEMIRNHILDQKHFLNESREVIANMETIPLKLMSTSKAPDPTLVVTRSDSERASAIVRSTVGKNAVAVLQIRSNGQFHFSASTKNGGVPIAQLDDAVKGIRAQMIFWKNWRNGNREIQNDWRLTQQEGYHAGTEEIYYFRKGSMVFNGSLTQPNVPGLVGDDNRRFAMTEDQLIDIVRIALEDEYWPKESRNLCSSGKCPAASSDFRCPIYKLGLYRCYKNRKGK